jgi:hypothetical protein
MVISSIDLATVSVVSRIVIGVAVGSFVVVVADAITVLTPMSGTALSGMTSMGVVYFFSFINLSSSISISLICAFCSMINFSISYV